MQGCSNEWPFYFLISYDAKNYGNIVKEFHPDSDKYKFYPEKINNV